MNKDLEAINKSITEIRELLNAECTPIDQLPDMVSDLSKSAAKSGYTTAFMFSTNSNPNTPTGGSLDTTTGLVVDIEDDWQQSINNANSANVYMSFAVFNPEGEKSTEWSTPVNLKGAAGIGIPGEPGPQGPTGLPGEQGAPGISYRTVQVYATTDNADTTPGHPRGGHWDMKTNTLSLPVSDDGTRWWANVDDDPNPKLFLWTSNATFMDNGNPVGKWSTPIRLNGVDGKNGVDGDNIEFIYRLLPDYDSYVVLRNHLSTEELSSPNEKGFVPDNNDSLNVGTEWENHPTGIDENMKVEVVCVRTKTADEPWSKWSNCTIWSKWGEDGMDGDGIEYIYLVTPAEINGIPTTSGHVKDTLVPTYSLDGDYQKDEFCFNDKWGFEGYDWTDEPRDVGPGEPMEWVMVRKQKDGKWQSFSDPALWATYSESGVSYITSFVFARGNVDNPPARPEGGDYFDPKPNGNIWSDTVPSDSNLPVWMSTRVFCSTSEYSDDDWSEPKMLADSTDFQVEYSAYSGEISREKISKFEGDSTEENEERWRAYQLSEYEIEWGDDTKIKNPVWMITATRHGGIWSDWTISKIKGEKGDKGEPGSSVKIEGEFETLDRLKTAWNKYVTTGDLSDFDFYSEDGIINQGDGWYIKNEGKLYSYSGGWTVGEPDTNFDKYWFGVDIKGKPGDSAYIYIAYCDENVATATVDLIGPGKYIGISTKDLSEEDRLKWSSYTWTKWEGEDGWGYEQIFLATSKDLDFNPENNHLPIPTNNEQAPEYLPPHTYGNLAYPSDKWSDTPILNEDYPFCWVVTRKVNGTTFGDWKGRDGKAALYSRYSYDGVSNVFVDLSNDLAVIPMEDGKVDPDFINLGKPVETIVKVYVGDEEVESSGFIVTGNNVTVNGAKVTLNLNTLTSNIKTIPLNVKLGDKTYTVNWNILQTDVAYELTPKTYSIRRYATGDKAGQLELNELTVDIWKWSDSRWVATNIPLFAYVVYTNGNDEIFSTEDRITVANNGVATINLRGLLNVASIKIYVVAQNNEGNYVSNGEILSFENITIVSDGTPGQDGTDGKDGQDGEDGKDGPGMEYIFCVTATDANATVLHNELLSCINDSRYQEDDFYPNKNNGYPNSDWTDDPRNVSDDKPLEWVSIRKKVNGVWGEFSLPSIWGKYTTDGKDGLTFKTSYVFARAISTPSNPVGGKFETGLPTNNTIWKDTIPSEGEGEVWMSYRMFRSDDAEIDQWSAPTRMTDTHNFEVIYGLSTANLNLDALPELPITEGIQNHNGWYDDANIGLEYHYMATATYSNGKWSNWVISKIKGEKGDKGEDGKSVSIKGRFDNEAALQQAWNKYFDDPVNAGFVYPLTMGDGYIVGENLWVYDGDGSDFADAWNNVGKIQGEPGQSMYLYVRYSNDKGVTMLSEGQVGKYIGLKISNVELTAEEKDNPATYNPWTQWTGDDGWGWEQVFKATTENIAPTISSVDSTNSSESDLIKKGWSDKPISVSETNKYIWYLFRKSNSSWQGETIANGVVTAALYDRYAKDGEQGPQGEPGKDGVDGNGIKSITKRFAVNNDPKNHPTSGWTEDMPSTSSENRYLWCEETTTYTKSSPTTIHYIVAVHGEPGASGTGNDAPIIYPAGVWSASKTYASTNEKCPYVFYAEDEKYYMVKANTSVPQGVVPTNTRYWDPIDSFEAIYADIGLFNQALVGKWVFHGDYMFSQEGVLGYYYTEETKHALYVPSGIGSGTMSGQNCSYEVALNPTLTQYSGGEFNTTIRSFNLWEKIENGIWIPNVLFNAVTGEGWFAGKKIQFNIDGSGSLGNGISWDNSGDITIEGSIFNPVVNATSSNCLNKTVCVSGDMKNPTFIGIDPYVVKSSNVSIKRIGSIAVTSLNLESPTYVTFVGASLQVSKIHTDKNDAVISHNNTYNSFIISPGATVTFDVFDDYTNGERYLRPQIQMGWFNRLGTVLPCTFNSIDYLDIAAVKHTPNGIGNSMAAGQFYELISLPENLVKYMSIKFNSLNDTYNSQIWFQKEADGISPSTAHSIANALNKAFYVKNSIVHFREGGSFGIGAYGVSPSISSNAYVDICLYDSNTMIGWFGFNI